MRAILTLFLVAFTVIACTTALPAATVNPPPVGIIPRVTPVWIDRDFSKDHRDAIHAALAEWNYTLNGYAEFRVESDTFNMEVSVLEGIERTGQGLVILALKSENIPEEAASGGTLAWVDDIPGQVVNVVDDAIGNRDLRMVMVHELGHILGAHHVLLKNTVMFPSYTYGSPCIDRATAQQVATVRNWDWHHMNFCEWPL